MGALSDEGHRLGMRASDFLRVSGLGFRVKVKVLGFRVWRFLCLHTLGAIFYSSSPFFSPDPLRTLDVAASAYLMVDTPKRLNSLSSVVGKLAPTMPSHN